MRYLILLWVLVGGALAFFSLMTIIWRGVDDLGNHDNVAQILEQFQVLLGRPGHLWDPSSDAESSQPVTIKALLVGNHLNDSYAGRYLDTYLCRYGTEITNRWQERLAR